MEKFEPADPANHSSHSTSLKFSPTQTEVRFGAHALRPALVIDSDAKYLQSLRAQEEHSSHHPVLARTYEEIQAAIGTPEFRYCGIYVNAGVVRPTLLTLIQRIRARYPATPLYVTCEGASPFTANETVRLCITEVFARPKQLSEIFGRIHPLGWPLSKPMEPTSETHPFKEAHASPGVAETAESPFIRVPLLDFLSGAPSPFDTYVRLARDRYVKITPAKEAIEPKRVLHYAGMGVEYLYLAKAATRRHQDYCAVLSKYLVWRSDISPSAKLLHAASLSDLLFEQIDDGTVTAATYDMAHEYLGALHVLIRDIKNDAPQLMRTYLESGPLMAHAAQVSILCALLAPALEITHRSVFEQLGLASLFHDVGLLHLPEHLRGDDVPLTTESERISHRNHPFMSTEILEEARRTSASRRSRHRPIHFDAATLQAIEQHHERRDGKGYPLGLQADQIHPFAEVLGLCEEFVKYRTAADTASPPFLIEALEGEAFHGFSAKPLNALKTAISWALA